VGITTETSGVALVRRCRRVASHANLRAATDPFVTMSRPIVYDNGARAEGTPAPGQSVCVVTNDKPAVESRRQVPGRGSARTT
jgi:hypothetical protein